MNLTNDNNGKLVYPVKPAFLITIDTEEDNAWAKLNSITTRNADFLPRFQELCEKFNFKPTYLTNFEMAKCPKFKEFGRAILARNTGEIGMHLHAWNSPPIVPLTTNDDQFHPYLIEYPIKVMEKKVEYLTELLRDTFDVDIVSHRAGRWSFNEIYAQILVKNGFCVDCSATPHISWRMHLGDPNQQGGTDYSSFPGKAYFANLDNISLEGESPLLEIPLTIISKQKYFNKWLFKIKENNRFIRKTLNRFFPIVWLRPNGKNLKLLMGIVDKAIKEKRDYIEFMLHSTELMPAGSSTFYGKKDIENLYADLEILFGKIHESFVGKTLKEYYLMISEIKLVS